MSSFSNIKELINTLAWARELLHEMFEKRKSFVYKYDHALEILSQERVETLISKGVIRNNGSYLEMDDQFQLFFEQILEVNEEINTSYINENIQQVKQQINFYLQENNENRKYAYLKQVKSALRKIGRITLRNIIDLNRNIENAFKAEANYTIKIARLEAFDEKRRVIFMLIEQTDRLVTEEERTFFISATDEELKQLVNQLRQQLTEARHNLIETQKQIIEYLNQVKYHSSIIEKIKQVKYLKDQFELRAKTNVLEILKENNAVMFEPKPSYPLKLSLDFLQTDAGHQSKLKVAARAKLSKGRGLPVAEMIAGEYLITETEDEIFINLDELKNGFIASGTHLFNFINNYRYPRSVSFEEKITIFCQMVGIYENEFIVSDKYYQDETVEYALVYPK
ncbi:hypothetical protein [Segetibacter sp.]|jgi:hypothetical protein|uniref:hypothetical protein n=1 Tax=Segetibacter sp. TaxID=2231182 RepID=UPI0026249338|nr:hypothetical protein [Segetibacter sp.]MCW3082188.1 hypothetical protein [Segetibacter sp.]